MTVRILGDCGCLHKLEKDVILESIRTNLNITEDILRGETAKFKQDPEYIKRLKRQIELINDVQIKTSNMPICRV